GLPGGASHSPSGGMGAGAVSAPRPPPQAAPQRDRATAHPSARSPRRYPEPVGACWVGVAAVIGEGHRLALQFGEPFQTEPDPLTVEVVLRDLGYFVVCDGMRCGTLVPLGRPLLRPDPIDRAPVRDGRDPC